MTARRGSQKPKYSQEVSSDSDEEAGESDHLVGSPRIPPPQRSERRSSGMSSSGGERCSICVCELELGDEVFLLDCRHLFHRECLAEWLSLRAQCPNCRGRIGPFQERDPLLSN